MIKAGIVGGTGYTGIELLRLLVQHPAVQLQAITSRSEAGKQVSELFPNLRGHLDLPFTEPDVETLAACDVVFFATPNGVAMKQVPALLERGVRVIDLAADFRIREVGVWEQWYKMQHACPELLGEAVYGLPEVNRDAIRQARLVANPGCYPTAVQLGFKPLLDAGLLQEESLVADCKSGASGAGRGANVGTLLCEAGDSFHAYGVSGHRHQPEIEQGLSMMSAGGVNQLTFVPHLLPMIRGIHATLYGRLNNPESHSLADIQALYEQAYANEPFVDVMPEGSLPETRSVRGANHCRIAVYRPGNNDTVVVLSVIDNLVKGAAGQAVQNMNIMFDHPESEGLGQVALLP
ncbi:N-acetyl-gamma-glutamyl-phosphate reductase [Parendozoicomonas haliclonae]|uniref:N-acetyl-gamma-glutamyl-phosphate reductase n=1 Tax=Parendozoicomonas haliclonae TaxID=1960125 RepID=A0A1X7ARI4_9GAMM|nr:N-acetyl-gamma-glutamyl-phosphate reductase [Parendozoicomonas haliclonae]SMA50017.1 N-acetyl-gamma-glutamyl-phosphate reductase [Parendozoicomonas haliclonae]